LAAETTAGSRYGRLLVTLAPLIGLLLVIGVFALMSDAPDQYLSVRNLRIVLAQTVIVALGAIGMTMIIVSGGIDLSVGSAIALTGVVTAVLLRDGYGPAAAIAAGVMMGGVVGILNGLAITTLKVLPFIATLGMLGVARGAAKWLGDQQTVNVPPTWVNELAVTFPTPAWLLGLILGEQAVLLLGSRRVAPARARDELDYTFRHPTLDSALDDVFAKTP